MSFLGWFITVMLITMSYIYYIYLRHPSFGEVQFEALFDQKKFKTGDLILFHALDNINPIFMGNYYGHIGVVYVDPDDPYKTPYLFEAASARTMPLLYHHNKRGIFLSPLSNRLRKYKGYIFYKELSAPLDKQTEKDFVNFINYANNNMYYEYNVIRNGIKKGTFEPPGNNTNCGEIAFLSLIKLGLLSMNNYTKKIFHHLKWMCNIKKLDNGYSYLDPLYIIDHPF